VVYSLPQKVERMRGVHPLFPQTPLILHPYYPVNITDVPQHFHSISEMQK